MGMWRNWKRRCFASTRLWVRVPSSPLLCPNQMGGDSMSVERALVIAILVVLFIAVLTWVF